MREAAVTIADNINISSITATGTISAKTTDGATIADLANHVQSLTTDVRTANDKLNLTSTVSAVTP